VQTNETGLPQPPRPDEQPAGAGHAAGIARGAALAVPLGRKLENAVSGALAAAAAVAAFAVVAYLLDRSDLRASAIRLRQYASLRR